MPRHRVVLSTDERATLAEMEGGLALVDPYWSVMQAADDVIYRARRTVAFQLTAFAAMLPKSRRWRIALWGSCAGVAVITGGSALAIRHVLSNS